MNATDILGEILRGGKGGGLKDIFSKRKRAEPKSQAPVPEIPTANDLERDASELEDLLGVGNSRPSSESRGSTRTGTTTSRTRTTTSRDRETQWNEVETPDFPAPLPRRPEAGEISEEREEAESLILLRAMIQAVKADGRLGEDERQALFDQVGGQSREASAYLQREYNRSCDVRDFAWSVPLGLEYKVYMISLTAIDLDTKAESTYLKELAHGLRLPPEVCAQIHRRCGVPTLR